MPFLPQRWLKVHPIIFIFISDPNKVPRDLKHLWTHHPNGPRMRDGINPLTGHPQSFYFPDDHPKYLGWFKGMEHIIRECHRQVGRDTSSVEILASEAVARLPLMGFFGVQELAERVVRLRAGWLSLGHPMS